MRRKSVNRLDSTMKNIMKGDGTKPIAIINEETGEMIPIKAPKRVRKRAASVNKEVGV
jgi:hypothetical protein